MITGRIAEKPPIANGLTAWHWLLIAALILALQAAILYAMGRLPICACGITPATTAASMSSLSMLKAFPP